MLIEANPQLRWHFASQYSPQPPPLKLDPRGYWEEGSPELPPTPPCKPNLLPGGQGEMPRGMGQGSMVGPGSARVVPELVSSQNSVQDITGALLKHSKKGSRANGDHIPHEKIVNLINDIFGAGRNQTLAPPSISACCSPTGLLGP